jgi:pSer/pThr/pTyr-binding forkhead associated (FHA) protein
MGRTYHARMETTGPEGERRVSDGERALAIGRLRRSYAAGYLSLDTFAERMDSAVAAKTVDELRDLLHDLPSMASIQERIRRALRRFRLPPPALPLSLPEEIEGESFTIGRSDACDLVLGDQSVSRRHAQLSRTSVGWLLSDLGSTNGTRVNGWRVKQVRVRPGDRVQVGRVRLRVTR